MSPVDYIPITRAMYPNDPPYQWATNETAPFTPLAKPLTKCKVAFISSGGVYHKSQIPFDPVSNDLTFREIPKDVSVQELRISHNAYDHTDAEKDINCIFPIERFRELEDEGFIGQLSSRNYTFMGRIFRRTQLQKEMTPQIAQMLQQDGVNAFLLIPA